MLDILRTLPAIMNDLEAADEAREALVFIAWRKIAGEMLAEHTVPLGFGDHRFVVAVSGRTWQAHLEDLSPQMIFKLNSILGSSVVKFIEFRIDESVVQADRAERKKNKVDAAELQQKAEREISPELAAAAGNIADENLKQAFLLAAASCIMRKRRISGEM